MPVSMRQLRCVCVCVSRTLLRVSSVVLGNFSTIQHCVCVSIGLTEHTDRGAPCVCVCVCALCVQAVCVRARMCVPILKTLTLLRVSSVVLGNFSTMTSCSKAKDRRVSTACVLVLCVASLVLLGLSSSLLSGVSLLSLGFFATPLACSLTHIHTNSVIHTHTRAHTHKKSQAPV